MVRVSSLRGSMVLLHRWVGLAIAAFLFVSGITGAVISWDHELDDWLNPHLHAAPDRGTQGGLPTRSAFDLARLVEERDPRVRVAYLPLHAEPGETLAVFVSPQPDPATGRLHAVGYNEVFLDPATGAEVGRREWGQAWPITRETLVSFLYKLHYSLHLPGLWGYDRLGIWFMGVVAALWTLDAFVGFYLTLPVHKPANPQRPEPVQRRLDRGWWARWRPAWAIKRAGSAYRITFDLHRAVSLWTWGLLFLIAFTAFSLNFYRELFLPVLSRVSQVTPGPEAGRKPAPPDAPSVPRLDLAQAAAAGRGEAERRGWTTPVGAVFYNARFDLYSIVFHEPGDEHGAGGVGPAKLYLDGQDGRVVGDRQPWVGTAADIFAQAQFPVHSGRILGLPGRILISLMGLVVAMLSVTGVVIWWRKRAARVSVRRKAAHGLVRAIPAE